MVHHRLHFPNCNSVLFLNKPILLVKSWLFSCFRSLHPRFSHVLLRPLGYSPRRLRLPAQLSSLPGSPASPQPSIHSTGRFLASIFKLFQPLKFRSHLHMFRYWVHLSNNFLTVRSDCFNKNTTDWLDFKQQEFTCQHPGGPGPRCW